MPRTLAMRMPMHLKLGYDMEGYGIMWISKGGMLCHHIEWVRIIPIGILTRSLYLSTWSFMASELHGSISNGSPSLKTTVAPSSSSPTPQAARFVDRSGGVVALEVGVAEAVEICELPLLVLDGALHLLQLQSLDGSILGSGCTGARRSLVVFNHI